jgi:hypothetical protein
VAPKDTVWEGMMLLVVSKAVERFTEIDYPDVYNNYTVSVFDGQIGFQCQYCPQHVKVSGPISKGEALFDQVGDQTWSQLKDNEPILRKQFEQWSVSGGLAGFERHITTVHANKADFSQEINTHNKRERTKRAEPTTDP